MLISIISKNVRENQNWIMIFFYFSYFILFKYKPNTILQLFGIGGLL